VTKSDRIGAWVRSLGIDADGEFPACYLAFFACFNAGKYYEAHDVLEHLWIETRGPERLFYKALIQLAGAFVHLQKHRREPEHPVHGRRLAPAARLLRLTLKNLSGCPDMTMGLNLEEVRAMALATIQRIEEGNFAVNPWSEESPPRLTLLGAGVREV
jgi:hypothetical protein